MGAKDSKPCCITYEEALKRVSDAEIKRLRDAFKRASTLNGMMTKAIFVKEVLGDGMPSKLAEHIFQSCGGTPKGIGFKDLLCGLVLLTRGYKDEKIKFIFGLYANEAGTHVGKHEMVQLVQACEGGYIPEAVADCFLEVGDCVKQSEKVTYEEFSDWLLQHPDATSLTRWLLSEPCTVSLSNDLEMPTFYQTLAGVTHLEEADIIELEKRYWALKAYSRTGKFDLETFIPLVCPPIPHCLCEGFFNAFDENRDDHIDFKEMACGISACCRGPVVERQKFCFKVFDTDRDGALNPTELLKMVEALIFVRTENRDLHPDTPNSSKPYDSKSVLDDILTHFDANEDGSITLDEYLVWSVAHPLPESFLKLLFQVCHIVLGLKPANREDEGMIVRDWLDREERRGFYIGQVWYLVSMEWWKTWHDYINYKPLQTDNHSADVYCNGNGGNGSVKRTKLYKRIINSEQAKTCNGETSQGDSDGSLSSQDLNLTDNETSSQFQLQNVSTSTNKLNGTVMPSPTGSPRALHRSLPSQSQFYLTVQKPTAIDNSALVVVNLPKVPTLTGEGGKLKRNVVLTRGRDFELVPEPVWKALFQWYGGSPALPRQVILPSRDGTAEIELYPLCLRLLRHQIPNARAPPNTWSGVVSGYGAPAYGYPAAAPIAPRRYLAYMASFSRLATLKQLYEFLSMRLRIRPEDIRLWHYKDENNMTLLEDECVTLEGLGVEDNDQILIEVRNKDQTWPEEMSLLASRNGRIDRKKQVPTEKGATGLNNLGNTCFMNAALQCVSNTRPLTQYFINNMHLYELNRNNPLGMKGIIAKRYGDLVQDLWSGTSKTIAPLKLRWTIGKYAPRFNGFQQHDSQELLAFLLDGLHEDLNRVHDKPYIELKDSDGRSDVIVAQEAWENHILRNKSIIVDLFHGQLKSCVRCKVCSHESVRFDPFNYLSLPLPMESCIHLEVIVVYLDGRIPVKYGLRLNAEEKYLCIKQQLSEHCNIPAEQLMLAEVVASMIKSIPADEQRIRTNMNGLLYAYEIPWFQDSNGYEDMPMIKQQEPQTLTQIQRMDRDGILARMNSRPCMNTSRNGSNADSPEKPMADDDAGSEASSQTTDDSGHSTLAEVHSSCSKHSRNPSNLSTNSSTGSMMSSSFASMVSHFEQMEPFAGFVIAIHRKMIRQDIYFLSSQKTRPSIFGLPLVLPCSDQTTHQNLYQATWAQVAHLVSPLPPCDTNVPNHAQDCDDSLGYEYPFILKAVQRDGLVCAWCPWYRFCRGCKIECNDTSFNFASAFISIDWDPTALHLRYQASQERITINHESVERTRRLQTDPIDLDSCLRAFTKEEELGEDEKYYCCKCKQHQLASKKLQIWRLPPILIVHLKRFQFVNGHWVKSQKIVKFPYHSFNPTNYLAKIPRRAVFKHKGIVGSSDISEEEIDCVTSSSSGVNSEATTPTTATNDSRGDEPYVTLSLDRLSQTDEHNTLLMNGECGKRNHSSELQGNLPSSLIISNGIDTPISPELSSDTVITTDVKSTRSPSPTSDVPQDFHQHRVLDGYDPFDLKYHLYAISCHSGILGGGHYVCYACNPNNRWYCYNDSSCKEVTIDQIDSDSAYMLFYEREGIDYERYLPNVSGKLPDMRDIDDEIESDFRKLCCLQ